ncbi:response regulator [Paenibacillus pinihumi]|uniref:response regulator n=1 Tax=Paenibacillus pinihumi TaxID=669462 RepID=UPI00048DDABB|nr:response regulator [Paenibacillus pinihumi]
MRLKALLVDDEVHILNNLSKVLPWADMGFEIIGLARSGVDALEMAVLHQPDLILSDIRMPVMDGITLVKKIREQGLTCEMLLLSGYQEFEYARTALRYGVRDYICKPINYMELEQTVRDIARQIGEQQKKQDTEQRLQEVASRVNETYLLHALLGIEQEPGNALREEEDTADEERYGVLLVDLEGYAHQSMMWTIRERKAWNLRLTTVLKDMLAPLMREYTVLQVREGEWCVVFNNSVAKGEMTRAGIEPVYERLQSIAGEKEGMITRMCVEHNLFSLHELGSVYQRMQQMLILSRPEQWYVDVCAAQMNTDEREAGSLPDAGEPQWLWIEQIGSGLRGGNQELLVQVMSELKSYVGHLNEGRVGRMEKVLHYLLIHLLREMRELHMLSGEQEEMIWLRLQDSLSLKELLSLMMSLIEQSKESLMGKKSSERLMMAAQSYIQQHLGKDFGIEDIADYLGISCSYFCLLFKNYFGETFVEHLTRQRIEAAKSLLGGSDKSITHIGSVVGYQERRYFTKVFQKYTGMTPSEYRLKESSAI